MSTNPTPAPPIADPEDLLGTYAFLPWLRQGVANAITAPPAAGMRASIHVELDLSGTPVAGGATAHPDIAQDISLYGPGDILGDSGERRHPHRTPGRGHELRIQLPCRRSIFTTRIFPGATRPRRRPGCNSAPGSRSSF